VLDSSKFWCCT
jgi:acyl-CoA reductase-like NAD-dependent aldehyde dehydrogenase